MKKTLKITFSVLLTAVMLFCLLASGAVLSVRQACTEERVYNRLNSIDWATVELSWNGSHRELYTIFNEELGLYFGEMTPEDFNDLFRHFSIDTVLISFVQDLRSWFFDYGPLPRLVPREIAATLLSQFDPTLREYFSVFGDPEEMLADILGRALETVDLEETLSAAAPYRLFVSETALYMAASSAAILFLILCLMHAPALLSGGICFILTGAVLAAVHPTLSRLLPPFLAEADIPRETFNIVYTLFSVRLSQNGVLAFLIGIAAVLLALFGWLMRRLIRRRNTRNTGDEYADWDIYTG